MKHGKRKLLLIVLGAMIALCLVFFCVGCRDNGTTNGEKVTVSLVNENGGERKDFELLPGDDLPVVEATGKIFEGYWTDSSCETKYEGTKVPDRDITLYYRWKDSAPVIENVTIKLIGEDGAEKDFVLKPGDDLPVIEVEDKIFEGYWLDEGCQNKYSGTKVPEENLTLYYRLYEDKEVTVSLISMIDGKKDFVLHPGEDLPVINVDHKDFEGYWTDSGYKYPYEGTKVPDRNITLYYRLVTWRYSLALDYGTFGTISFSLTVGDSVLLPSIAPSGTLTAGYAETKGGEMKYTAKQSVIFENVVKDQTLTLYAVYEIEDIDDYQIENGTLLKYTGNGTNLTLPFSATKIAEDAFKDNKQIVSVTIPASYTSIGKGAFRGCDALEILTVPFIGGSRTTNRFLSYIFGASKYEDNNYSFAGYSDGSSLYMGDQHFENLCVPQSLKTVRVTERTTEIAAGAFYSVYGLQNVLFDYPEAVRTVGDSAFENCLSLGYDSDLQTAYCFEWLRNVTKIGNRAFRAYTGNTESSVKVLYPYGEENPEYTADLITYEYPFSNFVEIPKLEKIRTIGDDAFYYCGALSSLTFGEELQEIGTYAFMYCMSIPELTFPDSTEKIGNYAFFACMSLMNVTFGTGIREIGSRAFAFNSALSQVVFKGTEPPVLSLQVFNNELVSNGTGDYDMVFADFRIYVENEVVNDFKAGCPDYVNYIFTTKEPMKPAYWTANGDRFDAKFEFTDGSLVYVTDPNQEFIGTYDYWAGPDLTYGATCGTYYPMLYEIIDRATYEKMAVQSNSGKHAKPLYENQTLIRLWHPELVDYAGTPLDNLYFFVTLEAYEENGERYLLPVMKPISYARVVGDTTKVNNYVITFNRFGVPQLGQVARAGGGLTTTVAVEDPTGTYYSTHSVKSDYSSPMAFYTFTYYNNKFEIITTDTYVYNEDTGVLTKVTDDSYLRIDFSRYYNDSNALTLDGLGGARVLWNGVTTNLFVGPAEQEIGEEGYRVTLYSDRALSNESYTLTFHDYFQGRYLRASLEGMGIAYDFLNVEADADWYMPRTYYNIVDTKFNLPQFNEDIYEYEWRYTSFTKVTTADSIRTYVVSLDDRQTIEYGYFRHYDQNGQVIGYGSIEYTAEGTTKFVDANGTERTSEVLDKRGSFMLGNTKYTYYDDSEDMTLAFTEDFYGIPLYYYTVKTDGYGNMYYLD